ncbi:MAG: metallopeptidase family protein [Bifidobacterium sp.]|nr:metallopeptidase family protein [Bifidobacterium sp.]
MHVSDKEFDKAVHDAVALVPDRFKKVLENIAITVAPEPTPEQKKEMTHGHGELLGLYQGTPITKRGPSSYAGVLPDVITIFKDPHERVCSNYHDLVTQIEKTVLHEIGHYFGFDDAYLHSHGY